MKRGAYPLVAATLVAVAPLAAAGPAGTNPLSDVGPGGSKAGPYVIALRGGIGYGQDYIGPTTGYTRYETQLAAALDVGYAAFGDGNGYVLLSPQLSRGSISRVKSLTAGVEYDLRLTRFTDAPLYVYPRMDVGYGTIEQAVARSRSFTMIFDLGIKYMIHPNVHVAVVPLSWAIYQIGDRFGESKFRFFVSAGIDFLVLPRRAAAQRGPRHSSIDLPSSSTESAISWVAVRVTRRMRPWL